MDIIGKWKIAQAKKYAVEGGKLTQVWADAEATLADESVDESDKQMLRAVVECTAEGKVLWCIPIPAEVTQEQIDAAIASGELSLNEDGLMTLEEKAWKEENGKLMYDTGSKGEVLGEEISPWVEITEEDGLITVMAYKLKKL